MTELGEVFAELGISHYLSDFVEQGFDTWETILDITESDFDALNVKLGHRRKIQRKIAHSRGLSSDRALGSPGHLPVDDRQAEEQKVGGAKEEAKDGGAGGLSQGAKRKYRRHPKGDENAPERPPSAYVIFSNKMREDLKGRNLSFTEIAKLVGENWQNLLPQDKDPYEKHAAGAKEKYASEMAEYKKTENYRAYAQYLIDFKARQSNQQPGMSSLHAVMCSHSSHPLINIVVNDSETSKRPKLDVHPSNASTGTISSGADTPSSSRAESSNSQRQGKDRLTSPQPGASSKSNIGAGSHHGSENGQFASSTVLPGYRESIYGVSHPSLPWRDGSRDDGAATLQQFSQANVSHQRSNHSANAFAESQSRTGSVQQSPLPPPPPPLMTSESISSTGSTYFSPHTPMEPPLERPMPLPSLFSQNKTGNFENQLPPLRPPSLSPQTNVAGHSPSGMSRIQSLSLYYFGKKSDDMEENFYFKDLEPASSHINRLLTKFT